MNVLQGFPRFSTVYCCHLLALIKRPIIVSKGPYYDIYVSLRPRHSLASLNNRQETGVELYYHNNSHLEAHSSFVSTPFTRARTQPTTNKNNKTTKLVHVL